MLLVSVKDLSRKLLDSTLFPLMSVERISSSVGKFCVKKINHSSCHLSDNDRWNLSVKAVWVGGNELTNIFINCGPAEFHMGMLPIFSSSSSWIRVFIWKFCIVNEYVADNVRYFLFSYPVFTGLTRAKHFGLRDARNRLLQIFISEIQKTPFNFWGVCGICGEV